MADGKWVSTEAMQKWLIACGFIAVAVDVLLTFGLAAIDPEYSHSQQYISELGATGRPYAAVFNTWCVVYGILIAGFAVTLGRGLDSRPALIAFLVIAATSAVSGIFPCDPGCACQTSTAKVHMLIGYVSLPAIIVAQLIAWSAMKGQEAWHRYRLFTFASVILLMAGTNWLAACHFVGRENQGCAVGAAQRLVMGTQYTWILVIAVQLWRLQTRSRPMETLQ
jgi:hypothetical membrane protein